MDVASYNFCTGTDVSQTMEVAIARVYNWDVVQRRKERAEEEGKEKEDKEEEAPKAKA